jgi:DNA-binding NtrC family response regulator
LERLSGELERNGGNVKQAAEVVGISRQRAYRLLGQQPTPGRAAHEDADLGDDSEHASSH